jgi:WD40 repeat protein
VLGYDGWLNCLTLTTFSGRPAVVGGSIDGRALVWRGETEALPGTAGSAVPADAALAGHDGWISGVAAVEYDDRDLIVTGGLDGTVRTWNLADADLLADRGDAHEGEVTTVSLLATPAERTVAVSGSTDGTVRLWRLADGGLLADPIPAHDQGVRVVTTAGLGGRATIASGGNDGSVRVWDAITGQPIGDPVAAHTRTVRALVLLSLDNQPMLITGGDGGVRRLDPISGTPIGQTLAGDQEIRAVAVTVADGRPVLVAGGDGGLYRWHLLTGEPIGPVLAAGERINAVAVGRVNGTAAVLAGTEAGVQRWALATGAAIGARRSADPIRSLVVSETGDHPVAVAGDDHGLTVHPLRGQRREQRILLGFRATAVAAVTSSNLLIGSWRGLYSLQVTGGG